MELVFVKGVAQPVVDAFGNLRPLRLGWPVGQSPALTITSASYPSTSILISVGGVSATSLSRVETLTSVKRTLAEPALRRI
jgi:hypothetical protein